MIKKLVDIVWKKQEKVFVIAMVVMGVFNFSIVFMMLYR